MSPFVRKVPTASGATAVQIADKTGGQYRIVEHLGSARTPEDLAALIEAGKAKLRDPGQATLDFDTADKPRVSSAVVKSSRSGLLVDRTGFPLEIGCFEGSKAETHTIIPVIKAFQERHHVTDMVVAADAGMLSAKNLKELDDAGLRFIVGSRQTKAPHDLATHFRWNGEYTTDGQFIDTITPKGVKRLDPDRVKKRREPVWS